MDLRNVVAAPSRCKPQSSFFVQFIQSKMTSGNSFRECDAHPSRVAVAHQAVHKISKVT